MDSFWLIEQPGEGWLSGQRGGSHTWTHSVEEAICFADKISAEVTMGLLRCGMSVKATKHVMIAPRAENPVLPVGWQTAGKLPSTGYYWIQWGGPGHSIGVLHLTERTELMALDRWIGPLIEPSKDALSALPSSTNSEEAGDPKP